jgi:UDP-GlcNAc:undecaprenyl-phosphate GlcNAc-1-phosphate transferase
MEYIYSLTVALFLTIALIPVLIKFSARIGLVDNPGAERKVHSCVMPRTGGLGIIVGSMVPLVILMPLQSSVGYLFLGAAIIVFFGLWDDRVELNFKWKLFGQALAAVVVMYGGVVVDQFPFFGLSDAPVWLTYPITFAFLVGMVNGVNFSDGLDGLAGGTSIMALLLIFFLALQSQNTEVALISLTLVGGVLGFLRYNTFPANIFMGDAGSQFLGFMIACLAIMVTQSDASPYSALLPVLLLGIPIMDILQVVPVRVHKQLPLPGPDQEHFHHQLGKLDFRHAEVVVVVYLLQAMLMASAFALRYQSDFVVAVFYFVFVAGCLSALLVANHYEWRFRAKYRKLQGAERRNKYLRRLGWYYNYSTRFIAVLLGIFFLGAGWYLRGPAAGLVVPFIVLITALVAAFFFARLKQAKSLFRVVLYSTSVFFAYLMVAAQLQPPESYWLIIYLVTLIASLMMAIRMTRKQDFSLTTQDLLILLVVVFLPLLPFEIMEQYAIGQIALIVAGLMYAGEFILNRSTRIVAFPFACAIAGVSFMVLAGN